MLLFLLVSSLGVAKQPPEACDFIACGKFNVEDAYHQKIRCVDSISIRDEKSAPLYDDKACMLIVSRTEKNKKTHFLVRSAPKHCELKKGDTIEMRIRDGGSDQSVGAVVNPCPIGTLAIRRPEDNPPKIKELESAEPLFNVDFFGVCTERRCMKYLKH